MHDVGKVDNLHVNQENTNYAIEPTLYSFSEVKCSL